MRENIFLKGISLGDGEVIGDNIPAKTLYESMTTPYKMTFKDMQKFIDESYNQLDSQIITESVILNEGSMIDKLKAMWSAIANWFKKIYGKVSTFIRGLFKKKAEDSGEPATNGGSRDTSDSNSKEPDTADSSNDSGSDASSEEDKAEDDEKDTKFSKAVGGSTYTKTFKRKGPLALDAKITIRYLKLDLYEDIMDCKYPGPILPIRTRDISDSSKILRLYNNSIESKGFITKYFVDKYKLKGYYQSIESVIKGINSISDSFSITYNLSEVGPNSKWRRTIINSINEKIRLIQKELDHKDEFESTAVIPDVDEDLAKKIATILNVYKEFNMIFFKVVTEACRQAKVSMNDAKRYNLIK